MNVSPMILRFCSGSVTPTRFSTKRSAASTWTRLIAELAVEGVDDTLRLLAAQEAVVDEDAGQLVADGFVDERGGDGGVDAAGERADDAPGPDFRADAGDGVGDEVAGVPIAATAADLVEEVIQDGGAVLGVDDFGVELDADDAAVVADGGDRRRRRKRGRGSRAVSSVMTSPCDIQTGSRRRLWKMEVALRWPELVQDGVAVFAVAGGFDAAASW